MERFFRKLFAVTLTLKMLTGHLVFANEAKPKYLYLLPTTQVTETSITSPYIHYGTAAIYNLFKFTAYVKGLGWTMGGLVLLADIPYLIPGLAVQSGGELELRVRVKNYRLLKEVAVIPHLKSIELLSFAKTDFVGPVANRRVTQRLVGLTTDEPLPSIDELKRMGWKEEWGEPISVENLENTRLHIHFKYGDNLSRTEWNPSLAEVHSYQPIPDEIAKAWRADLKEWTKLPWKSVEKYVNLFTGRKDLPLKLEGTLSFPDGRVLELGSFAEGAPVRSLLRGGVFAKLFDKPIRWVQARRLKPVENNLPHASIQVLPQSNRTCTTFFRSLLGRVTFSP